MGSRTVAIISIVVAVVLLVVGVVAIWSVNYNNGLVREWSGLQQSLAVLDTTISSTSCDFADIGKSAKDLKSRVDALKAQVTVRTAPPLSSRKKYYFIDYLSRTSEALASISVNCSTWQASEISRLDQACNAMRDAQTVCALALGATASKTDIFVATASTFNKMRQARKRPTVTTSRIVIVGGTPVGTTFVMPTDPILAGYISQMRSLLREYKSLRGGLDRYIDYVKRTGQSLEGSAYTAEFDSAIAARQSVLDRINSVSPPAQYSSQHQEAAACVRYGIDTMCELKRGDYPSFHSMSQQNTPRLARIRSIYGF